MVLYIFLRHRMITNQQWLDKCEATKQMAINELQDTLRLRESLFVARGRARNALRAQTDVTNYMLRRRIYDTQRARNELDWQKMKVFFFTRMKIPGLCVSEAVKHKTPIPRKPIQLNV